MIAISILSLSAVIIYLAASSSSAAKTGRTATEEGGREATKMLVPRVAIAPVEKPWTFKTLEIPADGLSVYLYRGARGWPKGGAITISTPDGRLLLRDQPGVTNEWDYPDGTYIFRADPQGSRREIQLYNRW